MGVILAVFLLIQGIAAVLLIIGIVKVNIFTILFNKFNPLHSHSQGQHKKMYMYLIVSFIGILLDFYTIFDSANSTRDIIKDLFGIGFQIYYFCIVYSLFTVIKYKIPQPQDSYTEEFV